MSNKIDTPLPESAGLVTDFMMNESSCEGEPYAYILKPVSQSIFELSQELKHEFGFSRRIRTHVDQNDEERVLVYDYFMDNLLRLIRNTAGLPVPARKHILQEVGLGLKDMHDKHWIHLGTTRASPKFCCL